jgi:glycosyltransferase involved in cell wall biosynthesis
MTDISGSLPKVMFVFRKPGAGHSIEQLFSAIADDAEKRCTVSRRQLRSYLNLIKDVVSIRSEKPSIVHITGACYYIALGLVGCKSVLTIHDLGHYLYTLRGWKRIVYRVFWLDIPLRLCTRITAISTHTKQLVAENLRIPANKINVVPDCYNPLFTFQPKQFNTERPRILQVGTAAHKNILRLADALEGLNCNLVIIGKLDQETRVRLQQRGIAFENHWNLSHEEVFQHYVDADLVTFVSVSEGFGVPIIEANAVGRPVITSDKTAMPEVAGDAACLVDPYSVEAIREGILKIMHDNSYREHLIARGLQNARRFTVEAVTEAYFDIYKTIQ